MEWLSKVLGELENKEELQRGILEGLGKHFVPRGEFDTINATKETLESRIVELEGAVQGAEKYKTDLAALQVEQERRTRFAALTQGRQWRDKLTEEAVYAQLQTALGQEGAEQAEDVVFQGLIADQSYFKNPNPPADMPPMGKVGTGMISDNQMRAIMGLPEKA